MNIIITSICGGVVLLIVIYAIVKGPKKPPLIDKIDYRTLSIISEFFGVDKERFVHNDLSLLSGEQLERIIK